MRRYEALSDGVFAIAMTLLILEIHLPAHDAELPAALFTLWPSFLAYLMSFVYLGVTWLANLSVSHLVARADARMLAFGILFLASVAFLPFPTALLADRLATGRGLETAAALYSLTGLWLSLTGVGMFVYARGRPQLARPGTVIPPLFAGNRVWLGTLLYVAAVVLSLVAPLVAVALLVVVPAFYLIGYLLDKVPVETSE